MTCFYCNEPIAAGAIVTWRPCISLGEGPSVRPVHRECEYRSIVGGIAHVEKRCTCYGGTDDPDGGLSKRESALRVWARAFLGGDP